MENRSVALRESARACGLCDKWYGEWKGNESARTLLRKFVEGIDFCIANDWPKIDMINECFTKEELRDGGVYLDEDDVLLESVKNPVLIGSSSARLEYSCYDVADVYVRHSCEATVVVSDMARVSVNAYDRCKVFIENTGGYPVFVYRHGKCAVEYDGNVVIRERK